MSTVGACARAGVASSPPTHTTGTLPSTRTLAEKSRSLGLHSPLGLGNSFLQTCCPTRVEVASSLRVVCCPVGLGSGLSSVAHAANRLSCNTFARTNIV